MKVQLLFEKHLNRGRKKKSFFSVGVVISFRKDGGGSRHFLWLFKEGYIDYGE